MTGQWWGVKDNHSGVVYPMPNKMIAERVADVHGSCEVIPIANPNTTGVNINTLKVTQDSGTVQEKLDTIAVALERMETLLRILVSQGSMIQPYAPPYPPPYQPWFTSNQNDAPPGSSG